MSIKSTLLKTIKSGIDEVSNSVYKLAWSNYKDKRISGISNPILLDSAVDIASKIKKRQITAEETIKVFIQRIAEVNRDLNFLAEDNFEDALEQARLIDRQLSDDAQATELIQKKPLLGVPFTLKINFCIRGRRHTAGAYCLRDNVSDKDAAVVDAMRKAGAIPLALTNVPELGLWWEAFNKVHGRTSNAYSLAHTCGGSSGGEGSILSACGSPVGIGSDIGGSIRMPAYFNGIYGHKPTSGIISNEGHLPMPSSRIEQFLTAGPMSKRVEDLRVVLEILARDNAGLLKLNQKKKVENMRLFYLEPYISNPNVSSVQPEVRGALQKAVKFFEGEYRKPVKKLEIEDMKYGYEIFEAYTANHLDQGGLEELLEILETPSMKNEVLKFFMGKSNFTWPTVSMYLLAPRINKNTEKFLNMGRELTMKFHDELGDDGVILYPPHPRTAPYHNQTLFMPFNYVYTGIFNLLKLPATQCPMGVGDNGLPLGVQIVADQYQDNNSLTVAEALNERFGWTPPCWIDL